MSVSRRRVLLRRARDPKSARAAINKRGQKIIGGVRNSPPNAIDAPGRLGACGAPGARAGRLLQPANPLDTTPPAPGPSPGVGGGIKRAPGHGSRHVSLGDRVTRTPALFSSLCFLFRLSPLALFPRTLALPLSSRPFCSSDSSLARRVG